MGSMSTTDWGTVLQVAGKVIQVGGKIYGGIAAKRAERRLRHRNAKLVDRMRDREQVEYEKQYNADATQDADAQRSLTNMENYLKARRAEIAGQQGVGMTTSENMAMQKQADNNAVAETTSTIAANAATKKQQLVASHLTAQDSYDAQNMGINREHYTNRMNRIKGGVQSANEGGAAVTKIGSAMGGKAGFLDTSNS